MFLLDDPIYISIISSTAFKIIRVVVIVLSGAALWAIVYFVRHSSWLGFRYTRDWTELKNYKNAGLPQMTKNWMKIVDRLNKNTEAEYKLAVIEADDLLNKVLTKMGYPGESLGDKFKILNEDTCPHLDDIKKNHATRNDIVHDPSFKINLEEAQKIISTYEITLKGLEII